MNKMKLALLIGLSLLILSACGGSGFYKTNAILGADVYTQADTEYLVYFYMPTCSYCREFKPTLEEYVVKEDALPIYKVNLALSTEKASWTDYSVQGTPTLVHIKNQDGDKVEVDRFVGVQKLADIPVKGK